MKAISKKIILAGIILIFFLFILSFYFSSNKMQTQKICFNEHCFLTELAKTNAQQTKGLMFRKSLDKNKAMLFVFDKPEIHNFWMKNCNFPLDIIFLDENFKVKAISENNQPCPLTGECPSVQGVLAKYVLEINGGLAGQSGLSEECYLKLEN